MNSTRLIFENFACACVYLLYGLVLWTTDHGYTGVHLSGYVRWSTLTLGPLDGVLHPSRDAPPAVPFAGQQAHELVRAALTVGAMGSAPSATFYLAALVELLSDDVPSVRMAAAVALGQVGPSADRACVRLVELLRSSAESDALREAAAVALGAIDDVEARAEERIDKQSRAHIEPVIGALVAVCASTVAPDAVRLAAMAALRRVVQGAWRLSSGQVDVLRPLALGERPPGEAAPAKDVQRGALDVLYPLVMEAVRGGRHAPWRLARSTRTAAGSESYGQLVL